MCMKLREWVHNRICRQKSGSIHAGEQFNVGKGWTAGSIVFRIFPFESRSCESISSHKFDSRRALLCVCFFAEAKREKESSMGLRCDEADCNAQSAGNKFSLRIPVVRVFLPYMIATTIWRQILSKESRRSFEQQQRVHIFHRAMFTRFSASKFPHRAWSCFDGVKNRNLTSHIDTHTQRQTHASGQTTFNFHKFRARDTELEF